MHTALVSWSGGKDSCFAAYKAMQQGVKPRVLLNVLNEEGQISRSHGIPASILQAQAAAIQLPIQMIASSWKDYEQHFTKALVSLKADHGITHAIFGDIALQAHRDWEEKVCKYAGLEPILPIWQQDRTVLVNQMLNWGIETMIVSCNDIMGPSFLGRMLTKEMISELEALGVDPCGENGEFHTLVVNCPLFKQPIKVTATEAVQHQTYWFTQLTLNN